MPPRLAMVGADGVVVRSVDRMVCGAGPSGADRMVTNRADLPGFWAGQCCGWWEWLSGSGIRGAADRMVPR